tara:strand:+ start:201 stop:302 length:102 start_codon:yes stop_codon:yes gene_type:complete
MNMIDPTIEAKRMQYSHYFDGNTPVTARTDGEN